jgi:hypothetical protein
MLVRLNTVETLKQEILVIPAKIKDCYLTYLVRLSEAADEEEAEVIEDKKKKKGQKKDTKKKNNKKKDDDNDLLTQDLEAVEQKSTTMIIFANTT